MPLGLSAFFIEHRDFAIFVWTARDTPESLDERDWDRFVACAYQCFGICEAAYINYQEGLIREDLWQGWDGVRRSQPRGAGYQHFWEQERAEHAAVFQQYVDSQIFSPEHRL